MPIRYGPYRQATNQPGGLGFQSSVSLNQFKKIVDGTGESPDAVLSQLEKQGYEVEGAREAKRMSAQDHVKVEDKKKAKRQVLGKEAKMYAELTSAQDNVFGGILASVPKTVGNLVKIVHRDTGETINSYINKALSAVGIDTESKEFKTGEMTGDIAQLAIPQVAFTKLGTATKIADIVPLINKYPKLAKILETGAEGALGAQAFEIINKGEFATKEETAIGAIGGGALGAISSGAKGIKELFTKAFKRTEGSARQVSFESAKRLAEIGEEAMKDVTKKNPIATVAEEITNFVDDKVIPAQQASGKSIGRIRNSFKNIEFNTDSILSKLSSKFDDLGLEIVATKGGNYKVKGPLEASERAKINDVVSFLGQVVDNEKFKGNLFGAEKISRYIAKTMNDLAEKSKLKTVGAVLSEFGEELGDDIIKTLPEDQASDFIAQKGIYRKYINLIKDAGGKDASKGLSLLQKALKGDPKAIDFFNDIAEEAGENYMHKGELARFIQVALKDKEGIERTLGSGFYPSKPGAIEFLIKKGTNSLFDSIEEILKLTKDAPVTAKRGAGKAVGEALPTLVGIGASELDE